LNHHPYSLDLVPSDYHLFGPTKEQLEGQKFSADDSLKHGALNWLHSQPTSFCAASIVALPWQWQKCVSVEGQYLEKEFFIW
jgi:histone-lysine N-methyltransferase SETMAR